MQALILVGGHGTRLRPVTLTLPKPVIPLVDRPFLRYMIDWLGRHGVDDIVMACGFRPDDIRDVLGDGIPGGPRLRYVEEPEPRGTAGAIKFAEDLLEDRFFALNGDVLTDLDLTALLEQHESSRRAGDARPLPGRGPDHLRPRPPPPRRRDHRVPREARPRRHRHRRGLGRRLRPREVGPRPGPAGPGRLDRARGLPEARRQRPLLAPPRGLLDGHRHARALPRRLLGHPRGQGRVRARRDGRRARQLRRRERDRRPERRGRRAQPSSTTTPTSAPTPRSARRPSSGWASQVGAGALVEASALHPGCFVGDGAVVRGSILASDAVVEAGALVPYGSVIGAGATITADAGLEPGARVDPESAHERRPRRAGSAPSTPATSSTPPCRSPTTSATRSGASARPGSSRSRRPG